MSLQQHPLSAVFPAMDAADFDSLTDSIENIGVQNPITLYDGMVIDGWHRYRAASDLGMDCPMVELGDVDPRDFVMAQNKARRHITQAQLAMATTAVYAWRSVGQNQHTEKRVATECPPSKTNAELAAIAGVGVATIKQSKAVQATASPEVVEAVKSGEIGLPKAAAIAKLPQSEQAAAIYKPTPKPVQAPESEPEYTELDAARDQIGDLQTEIERLSDRLAVEAIDASEEEKTAASKTIASLRAEVQTLTAHLSAVTLSRDTLQEENAQLKKQCQMYRNKLDKLSA
jgi:FtsZ-binding cell division protein ZapB